MASWMTDERRAGSARGTSPVGFTLVEIMVSALVLAIGMMAALAMQYAALGGVTGSQDLANATELSERMISMVKQESQQWRGPNTTISSIDAVYSTSNAPWSGGNTPILPAVQNQTWTWLPVTTQPVDVRLTTTERRRYCVFVRGGETSLGGGIGGSDYFKLQIAVVYPGGNKVFPGADPTNAPAGQCTELDVGSGYLEPPTPSGGVPGYESDGYRAVFSGVLITPRGYLGPQVTG